MIEARRLLVQDLFSFFVILLLVASGVVLHYDLSRRDREWRTKLELSDDQQYRLILQAMDTQSARCAIHVDRSGDILWANENFVRLTGVEIGQNLELCIPREHHEQHNKMMTAAIDLHTSGGKRTYTNDLRALIVADGTTVKCYVKAWTVNGGAMAFIDVLEEREKN